MRQIRDELLGRGGRMLGLAALAHARRQRAGAGPWYVLPPEMVAAAEQLLAVLERGGDHRGVAAAVNAALGFEPATAAPSWAAPVWEDSAALERIGQGIDIDDLERALHGSELFEGSDARGHGLAALAVALCRSIDGVEALGLKLAGPERSALTRMARLAGARVTPGQPTRVRNQIRRLLKGEERASG